MTKVTIDELRQQQVLEYLYGDLDANDRGHFEQALADDLDLKRVFELEQRLDTALPPGFAPLIDEERLQGNRWLLRQNLQKATRPRFSLLNWLRARPLFVIMQGATMAMTFVLGLLMAGLPQSGALPAVSSSGTAAVSPLALIGEDEFEIFELRVNEFDAETGAIDLTFALASESQLRGNVADERIHQLMAVALQDDIGSADRLETINALEPVRGGNDVYRALIHVLLTDENPGVRYQAVSALADLADQDGVKDALRLALRQDMNQGVRVEAFNALSEHRDEETLALFREQMQTDSNEYIRARSREIVESRDGQDLIL